MKKQQKVGLSLITLFLLIGVLGNLSFLMRVPYCDDGKREVNYYSDGFTDTYLVKYDCLHKGVLKEIHKNIGEDIKPYNDIQCKFLVHSRINEGDWHIYCFDYEQLKKEGR